LCCNMSPRKFLSNGEVQAPKKQHEARLLRRYTDRLAVTKMKILSSTGRKRLGIGGAYSVEEQVAIVLENDAVSARSIIEVCAASLKFSVPLSISQRSWPSTIKSSSRIFRRPICDADRRYLLSTISN
jgi:hypothetical protein